MVLKKKNNRFNINRVNSYEKPVVLTLKLMNWYVLFDFLINIKKKLPLPRYYYLVKIIIRHFAFQRVFVARIF